MAKKLAKKNYLKVHKKDLYIGVKIFRYKNGKNNYYEKKIEFIKLN